MRDDLGNIKTKLAGDSYYAGKEARQVLIDDDIPSFLSISGDKSYKVVHELLKPYIKKSGDVKAAINKTTGEFFLTYWDPDPQVGKKSVWSNCVTIDKSGKKPKPLLIPGYDVYNTIYQFCDLFNRALKDKRMPHRAGAGKGEVGDTNALNDFVNTVSAFNTMNIWSDVRAKNPAEVSYDKFCIDLAKDLVRSLYEK